MFSNDRRKEIATFLRLRRARLQPEQVGLPRGPRRRTPGLRREEVAALAEVSTEWYTWLEQAREVRPSADTLRRIGGALRLEPAESQHLLSLGGYGAELAENGPGGETTVSPHLQQLMDQLAHCPAWVHGERWDILAWNRAATVIHGDLEAMEGLERNGIHQLFLNPRIRRMLVDWELHARDCVARLRLAHSRHVDDPWFNDLIHLVQPRSREFAAWWDEHNVLLPGDGVKAYDHPEAGPLTFDYATLDVNGEGGRALHLVTYVPARGTGTQERMEALLGSSDPLSPSRPGVQASRAPRAESRPPLG